jgi:hypothetical protein
MRKSLYMQSWERAVRLLADWEASGVTDVRKAPVLLAEAVSAFLTDVHDRGLPQIDDQSSRQMGSQFIGSLPTSEPPEIARGYSSNKRTASASQPVKGLNCIQESFSRSDLLRCSFVANLPFR